MQGDFSRLTFDPRRHYRSVRMQQGRVQLDADWNEQIDILNYIFETQLKDMLGSSGASQLTAGFKIVIENNDDMTQHLSALDAQASRKQREPEGGSQALPEFSISAGRYYVDGVLCENEQDVPFSEQPYYPQARITSTLKDRCLVYLDVWQRHITAFEDASLREIALGGIDTTTRVQTIWQVKLLPITHEHSHEILVRGGHVTYEEIVDLPEWNGLVHRHEKKGKLAARHISNSTMLDNQLYRVEIHRVHDGKATFKWSRENASIVFDIEHILSYEKIEPDTAQCTLIVSDLGRDLTQLQKGDWVEFVNDETVLRGYTLPLYQVSNAPDATRREVTLVGQHAQILERLAQQDQGKAATLLIRRWDHSRANAPENGTRSVEENIWLDLEHGIQVCFSGSSSYNVGDYWLLPARTLLNDVEWPCDVNGPLAQRARGIQHHYCPLALLHLRKQGWTVAKDLRRIFAPLPVLTERTTHMKRPEEVKAEIIEEVQVVERNVLYEECTSREKLGSGDLVSLIPGTNLQVTRANRENAKLIFGVVSGATEADGEQRYRVTVYGRARCKVVGAVEAGDLLTVAEKDGCATKTGSVREFFHAGSLVGKALHAYSPETSADADDILPNPATEDDEAVPGMIDIMVTLQ
ncbi:MAG TPA: DUF6519 domain-containing protein [Ktedonobacteraceae bacterium]|nr:DUF6519 domain-containing protein [Ktedonobacteraceae bacterium]